MNLAGAALRGVVRERNSSLGTGGLCFGDVVFAARRGRLAGAALLGEVRVASHAEDNAEQIFCGSGEDFLVSRPTQRAELVLK